MRLSTRQRLILQQLEENLSPNGLSSNPFLVSQLFPMDPDYSKVGLPIHALFTLPGLLKLNCVVNEVTQCCSHSKFVDVKPQPGLPMLSLRYRVIATTLVVRHFTGSLTDLYHFVEMVHGQDNFSLTPGETNSIRIAFDQPRDSIAVWRALRIVPFHGVRLEVAAQWVPSEAQSPPPPPVPKIVVQPRSRSPVKLGGRTASGDG
jgi:hypothetical protein